METFVEMDHRPLLGDPIAKDGGTAMDVDMFPGTESSLAREGTFNHDASQNRQEKGPGKSRADMASVPTR